MRNYLIVLMVLLCISCLEDRKRDVQLSSKMKAVKDSVDTYFSKLTELKKFNGVVLVYKKDTLLLKKPII